MSIYGYVSMMQNLQKAMLEYLNCEEDNLIDDFEHFKYLIDESNILDSLYDFSGLLHMISNISQNFHPSPALNNKVEQILSFLKESIKKNFTDHQIFHIFKSNKRLLYYLIANQYFTIDQYIANTMMSTQYQEDSYSLFFYPELKDFMDEETDKKAYTVINAFYEKKGKELFEIMRKNGENDEYICELIRHDSVSNFIAFLNKNNISPDLTIDKSIFETNSLLNHNKDISLIEYSAFFGAIQIFQYLLINATKYDQELWLFAINGANPEIIHLLESHSIKMDNNFSIICLLETIKCHCIDITEYFFNTYFQIQPEKYENVFAFSLKYFNYVYFPRSFNNEKVFYFLCKYDQSSIVDILISQEHINEKIDINATQINFCFCIKYQFFCLNEQSINDWRIILD